MAICLIFLSGCIGAGNQLSSTDTGKKKFFIGQAKQEEPAEPLTDKEQEKIDEAVDNTKAVLDPEYSDVLSSQAFNLIRSERYEEAIIMFDRAIALNPGNTIAKKGREKAADLAGGGTETSQDVENRASAQALVQLEHHQQSEESAYFLETGMEFGGIEIRDDCDLGLTNRMVKKSFFPGLELFWDIPEEYRLGEIVNISGKVTGRDEPRTVSVFIGPPENQTVYVATVQEKIFTIPVYMEEAGEFLFTVVPGAAKSSAKAVKIRVRDPDCEPAIDVKTDIPSNLNYKVTNGSPVFYWNDDVNNLFRVEFTQKRQSVVFYIRDELRLAPPLKAFKNFSEGTAKVKIWGAKTSGNTLDRLSTWMSGEERDIFITEHVSRKGNSIDKIKITEDFVIGETIEIRGESDEELESHFMVIDRNGNLESPRLSFSRNKFSGSYKPDRLGTHLVGIYGKDGAELFVGGVVPQGSLPLIPDYLDLDSAKQAISESKVAENMIRYVNHERNIRDLPPLEEKSQLDKLAQYRADDMCSRLYFKHENPDGNAADYYKLQYEIFGEVAENMVEESDLRYAHEKIMRSPKYHANIIDEDHTHIGFGVCAKGGDATNSIIVQILEKPIADFDDK